MGHKTPAFRARFPAQCCVLLRAFGCMKTSCVNVSHFDHMEQVYTLERSKFTERLFLVSELTPCHTYRYAASLY